MMIALYIIGGLILGTVALVGIVFAFYAWNVGKWNKGK